MRVCPKCGYMDSPVWRHVRHRLYTNYCRIDDLGPWEPALHVLLKKKIELGETQDFILSSYIYHFVKGNVIIQRIHVTDSRDGKTHREPEQEKLLNFRIINPNQRRLLEDTTK